MMRRVGVDKAWVVFHMGPVLLMMFLQDAGAQTSYHFALPSMPTPTVSLTLNKVAVLHASNITGNPVVLTPDATCNTATVTNPFVLDANCAGLLPSGVGVSDVGIHVTHTDQFRLHVIPISPNGASLGDGFLAVPDEHLGDEYYVVTYCTLGGRCQFSVVATADNTSVNVEFPMDVDTIDACISGTTVVSTGTSTPFTLHENQVLHVESDSDLSGTYISADQNVAVFSGSYDNTVVGQQLYEQLLPTRKWSKSYIVMPNDLNDAGDIVKIMPLADYTEVYITGYSDIMMPKKGKAVERRIDWRMFSEIRATKPIQVVQIMGVDLYNDTANVGGPRAMVHLQSRDQWLNTGTVACSDNASEVTRSMVSIAGDVGNIPPVANHLTVLDDQQIQGTDISASVFQLDGPLAAVDLTLGGSFTFGPVGYCVYGNNMSASAMLLSNNLDVPDSVSCAPSLSTPGDDLDNDCNELHDELTCTLADLKKTHTSTEDANGYATQYSREIAFDGYLKFKVETCEVAEVLMWCSTDPEPHVSLQISSTGLNLHVEGGTSANLPSLPSACNTPQSFWLEWSTDDTTDTVVIKAGSGVSRTTVDQINVTTTEHDCFDWLTFHSLSGESSFEMESGKDCGKIISGTADNFGLEFVVPINDATTFKLYVTDNGTAANVSIRHPDMANLEFTAMTSDDLTIDRADITGLSTTSSHLILTADSEVSVFATATVAGSTYYGVQLLPTDILGPAYPSIVLEATTTNAMCKVFSTDRQVDIDDHGSVEEFGFDTFTQTGTEPGPRLFFKAKQVMPVFCGDFVKSVMQIPPRETMGMAFYVPPISFGGDANVRYGYISIMTLEDSTYVKILGDYDREDIVDLRYSHYERQMSWTTTTYVIETNKPVLAYLELQFEDKRDVIALPPVNQYKTTTRFPATGGTVLDSWGIDDTGNATTDPPVASSTTSSVQPLTFGSPTFFVAVVDIGGVKHIMTSDFGLADINELCVISDTPTPDVDDDCDGLVDEDVCYVDIVVGMIDSDIDGTINEDCAPGVGTYNAYSVPSPTLNISASHIECGGTTTTTGTVSPGISVPPTTMPAGTTTSASVTAPIVPPETSPTFDPIDTKENITASVSINTTTSDSNNTLSLCDGVCPCGWVDPPNMTEAELMIKVEQIQEKLKIQKTELSAWVRKKTSAQDNRPSATAVGSAGVTFLVVCMAAIGILDMTTLARDVRMLRDNLRQACEM